jgi:hypothetical protein
VVASDLKPETAEAVAAAYRNWTDTTNPSETEEGHLMAPFDAFPDSRMDGHVAIGQVNLAF